MSSIIEKLDRLKRAIHPEEPLNIIDQCAIVAEALEYGSPYEEDNEGLRHYLEISSNQVYKMNYVHHYMIPEVKEGFKLTDYQCHKAYSVAVMSKANQLKFLDSDEYKTKAMRS